MTKVILSLVLSAATLALTPAIAAAQNSAPTITPIVSKIPDPVDVPLSAPIRLEVDATDNARGIFRVKQTIPVEAGKPLVLLYPEWLPGKHGPRGAISELAGLKIRSGGKLLKWTRDPVEVFAFHVDVPAGAKSVEAEFQFLSPVRSSEGRIVMTPDMMNVQWEQVALYPAGHFTRAIRVKPSITLPQGFIGVAALDGGKVTSNRIDYAETDFETMVDSPMFAGKNYKKWDLGQNVTLNVWADEAKDLEAKPEHIDAHKALVSEAITLFGSKHFDRYEFLLALTDKMGGIGLEHHRSSENSLDPKTFTDWKDRGADRGLLPHELTHSWNGKFRRSDVIWTPDYRTPMQDNLLWVYEGQTSYWDWVLAARSGIQSKEIVLGELARAAAFYQLQPGRDWRSVEDTTHDPIYAARKPKPNATWSRGEDYYVEGSLVWLEADMIIREKTGGKKSLDDFAKAFFGIKDGDWGTVTYNFDEVARTLNGVTPYDWAGFLDTRIRQSGQPAPWGGIEKGGYKVVWKDEPNAYEKERMKNGNFVDLTFSLGMNLDKEGVVTSTVWDGPAFQEGIVNGTKIIAVDGIGYSKERINEAVKASTDKKRPVKLLVELNKRFREITLTYSGGQRYAHLEPINKTQQPLDRLLLPRRK